MTKAKEFYDKLSEELLAATDEDGRLVFTEYHVPIWNSATELPHGVTNMDERFPSTYQTVFSNYVVIPTETKGSEEDFGILIKAVPNCEENDPRFSMSLKYIPVNNGNRGCVKMINHGYLSYEQMIKIVEILGTFFPKIKKGLTGAVEEYAPVASYVLKNKGRKIRFNSNSTEDLVFIVNDQIFKFDKIDIAEDGTSASITFSTELIEQPPIQKESEKESK